MTLQERCDLLHAQLTIALVGLRLAQALPDEVDKIVASSLTQIREMEKMASVTEGDRN